MQQQFHIHVRQILTAMCKPPYPSATSTALDPACSFTKLRDTKFTYFLEQYSLTLFTFNFYE